MILGYPIPKVKIIILLSTILIFVLSCLVGGFFFVQKLKQETKERMIDWTGDSRARSEYVKRMDPGSPDAVDPLEALRRFHIEATGFDRVTSLRLGGRYIADGISLELTIMGRKPNRFLQKLKHQDRQLTVGLIDGEIWYQQNSPLLAEENDDLTQINRVLMIMECAIPLLAWEFSGSEFRRNIVRLPDEVINGVEVAILENHVFPEVVIRHQIDLHSGLELARTSLVSVGESQQLIELVFKPPAPGIVYPVPSGYSVRINQSLVCTAVFETYEFNIGLAPFLFNRP